MIDAKRKYGQNVLENHRPKVSEQLRRQLETENREQTTGWAK